MFTFLSKGEKYKIKSINAMTILLSHYTIYYSMYSASISKCLIACGPTINEGQPPRGLYSIKRALLR